MATYSKIILTRTNIEPCKDKTWSRQGKTVGKKQRVHWFLGGKSSCLLQWTSVWVGSPKSRKMGSRSSHQCQNYINANLSYFFIKYSLINEPWSTSQIKLSKQLINLPKMKIFMNTVAISSALPIVLRFWVNSHTQKVFYIYRLEEKLQIISIARARGECKQLEAAVNVREAEQPLWAYIVSSVDAPSEWFCKCKHPIDVFVYKKPLHSRNIEGRSTNEVVKCIYVRLGK